eukprot:scaffold10106_cov20-Tisochrysis_lutea.AAC.4
MSEALQVVANRLTSGEPTTLRISATGAGFTVLDPELEQGRRVPAGAGVKGRRVQLMMPFVGDCDGFAGLFESGPSRARCCGQALGLHASLPWCNIFDPFSSATMWRCMPRWCCEDMVWVLGPH